MYDSHSISITVFLVGILSLILVITFFVMAYRLKRIMVAIEELTKLEISKPESHETIKCEKCGKDFDISITKNKEELIDCPHCKNLQRI